MSEQKSVSPLLDGFVIGTPVNEHFGVCCYPAVMQESQRKCIVKVISIPASQAKLDALLITGAYRDAADAAEYFHTLADEVVREAEFLRDMSRLEGFIPFEGCQIEPMQKNRIGYEVYLLSGFRLSLERYMHRNTVTHLEAVNLGIDLCTALAACRRAGKIYIDLKPSNIYISTKKEFKIGDLGFASLDSMQYVPMPEKYRSCYTAPELLDDLSVLNGTADTYAVGMILYQLFNNGILPENLLAPLPAPVNADAEMAAILLKACSPKPEDRWEDPVQMGQALVDYLQSVAVNNTPIMAPITGSTLGRSGASYETTKFPVQEAAVKEAAPAAETSAPEKEQVPEEAPKPEIISEKADQSTEVTEEAPIEPAEETPAEPATEAPVAEAPAEEAEDTPAAPAEEAPAPVQPDPLEVSAAEIEAAAAAEFAALTGDVSKSANNSEPTLNEAQLDSELTALHQILKPEKKAPAPANKKKEKHVTPVVIKPQKKKKSPVAILFTIFLICLLMAGSAWGYLFYTTAYKMTVDDLTVDGTLDRLTVYVKSDLPDGTLTAVCSDPYGNSSTQHIRGGKAEFKQLTPGTFYTIQLEVDGIHKLLGPTSTHFTTESITTVAAFTAAVGSEDGSAVLNLMTEGHIPEQWHVFYTAEGEPELRQTFSGNSTTIDSLVIGKTYTFRLESANGEPLDGDTTAELKASRVITARNVRVVSCDNGNLTVEWDTDLPDEANAWIVHCYGQDYDEVQELTEMTAVFSGVSSENAYTIDVCAKGMGQGERETVSANPIQITDFQVDTSVPQELTLHWEFTGKAPEGGWLIQYTLDNSDLPSAVKSMENAVTIAPRIPGAVYHFSIQAGDVSVLNRKQSFSCPAAEPYSGRGVAARNLSCELLPTPPEEWSYFTVGNKLTTNVFVPNASISAILGCNIGFYLNPGELNILYVYRDVNGNALAELIAEETVDWRDLWNRNDSRHTELTIPTSPSKVGSYTLDIYFDGMSAVTAGFIVN